MSNAVAFYVSGHGFGHASRQIEIINALGLQRPDTRVLLRTSVPRWLLERTLTTAFELDDRPCDTGVVQIDSLRLDAAATIANAAEFYATLDARADAEAALLGQRGIALVIADAPPLACVAAAKAGLPAVVVSNFTWDWIYGEYREYLAAAPGLLPALGAAYATAAAWRLPMHGGFESFKSDGVIDLPFVARHASCEPAETRARLGLPAPGSSRKLALPSFGGYGVEGIDLNALDLGPSWQVVNPSTEALGAAGVRYEDVVRAVDAVVTKPGYGIIAECIANQTPLVYTSRGRFREYPVLVREMPRYLRCAYLGNDDLLAGRWQPALDAALASPAPPEQPRTDGAQVVAGMIAKMLAAGVS